MARSVSRTRQGAVTRVLPNAESRNAIPKHYPNLAPVQAAPYNYLTSSAQNPPAGSIYCAAAGLNIFINQTDAAGQNHADGLATVQAGDTLTIGPSSGMVANNAGTPGPNIRLLSMVSWTAPPDGPHNASITRATPAQNPPVCSINPHISPPFPLVEGSELECGTGTWRGLQPITFDYAWYRDGVAIPLATSAAYVLELDDLGGKTLTCQVTGTNLDGATTAASNKIWIP